MKNCTVGLLLSSIGCFLGIALPSYGYIVTYSLTTVSVTAGDLDVVSPDTFTEYADDVTEERVFMRINNNAPATKTDASFVLDMGEAQLAAYFTITNRPATSDSNIKTLEIYVGDESSGYPSSFDTCVYSGSPSGGNGASVVRKIGLTSTVYKRYFLVNVVENFDGVLDTSNSTGRYADFSDVALWTVSDVSAGQLTTMRPDGISEYFELDGIARKTLRITNGADGSKMDASFVLDRGETQERIGAFTLRNRLDSSGYATLYSLKIYVGDESSGYPSSFNKCIFDGTPSPAYADAGLERSIVLTSRVYNRYFLFTVEQNFDGWLTENLTYGETKYADFYDIVARPNVSAGDLAVVLPDRFHEYYSGETRFLRIENGDAANKTDASFVLDGREAKLTAGFTITNRPNTSDSNIKTLEIYVGDESSGCPSSFNTCIYSGIPSPSSNVASTVRKAVMTSAIVKRYFLFKVVENYDGVIDNTNESGRYADFTDIALWRVGVPAGSLTTLRPDGLWEAFLGDGVTRRLIRTTNGADGSKMDSSFVLDRGGSRYGTAFTFLNRDATTDAAVRSLKVYVGDESSGYPSSFDTCIFDGTPSPDSNTANVTRNIILSSPVMKRFYLFTVEQNWDGWLTENPSYGDTKYADFNDIAARPHVTAGNLDGVLPDRLAEYNNGTTRTFIRIQNGDDFNKTDGSFVLDMGEAQLAACFDITNRNATSDSNIETLEIYVGDESSGYPSSFNTCIYSGTPSPSSKVASEVRKAALTSTVYKRYFLFKVLENFDGVLEDANSTGSYADFSDVALLAVDVPAGQLIAIRPDATIEYFFEDGVTRKLIRIGNGDNLTKTDASFILDQGSSKYVSSLLFKNRLDTGSNSTFNNIQIYVGDESSGYPAAFNTLVYSGIPKSESGEIIGVGLSRYAHFASPIAKRYFMVKVTTNLTGPLTTDGGGLDYADFGSVEVPWTGGSSATTHTVTAGSVSALEGDVLSAYSSFGSHGFMVSDGDEDDVLYLLVDQGSSQSIDMLQVTNRADETTTLVPKIVRCWVAADEGAGGFDPQLLSSYTVEIGSGALDPVATVAGMKRSIDLTDVTRRYMVLEIQSNLGYYDSPGQIADIAFIVPSASVNASTFGFNSTDATDALQAAICSRASVVNVPNMGMDWIVRPLYFVSDQEIVFADGVTIQAKSGEFQATTDCLFTGRDVSNLTLTGPNATFKMCMSDYDNELLYTFSEWRHAVRLDGCEDVTISGLTMTETGGDGICLLPSYLDGVSPCSDITIENVVCDNNYRQGMSVMCVDTLLVDDCVFRLTAGTAPKDGIDFEPNASTDVLTGITVQNSIFESNANTGIEFETGNLASTTNYDALIENCTFYGNDANGLKLFRVSPSLVVKDCLFVNNTTAILNHVYSERLYPTYCGFWGNTTLSEGRVTLSTGCVTAIEPVFASTTFGDADYMYLDENCPTGITEGASDSSYMGARPVAP